MSELDAKQKVLLALYTEYQKDIPNMKNITAHSLDISEEVFIIALQKLENEELIRDIGVRYYDNKPHLLTMEFTKMTRIGIEYVEEKMDILRTMSGREKVKEISKKVTTWGYKELKEISIRVLTDLGEKALGLR